MDKNFFQTNEYAIQIDNLLMKLFTDIEGDNSNIRLTSSLHTHSHAEIFSCNNGNVHIKTEHCTATLYPGDIAIVPSGLMHLKSPDAGTDSEWIRIGIVCAECSSKNSRDLYHRISSLTDNKDILVFENKSEFFELIKKIASSAPNECEPCLVIDFVSALSKLVSTNTMQELSAKEKTKHKIKNMDRFLKLDHFINHEFMNHLSNEEIAKELHISERQLSRLVLNHYGTTLHTLIHRKRISVAAKLLVESSDSIENIALSVGFNSKIGFYREFKKVYGMTPAQYRIQNESTTNN